MNLGATELFHSVTPTGSGYIYNHGQNLEISLNPFARAIACSALEVSGSSSRRQQPPVAGLRRRQRDFCPAVAAVASPRRTRVWT